MTTASRLLADCFAKNRDHLREVAALTILITIHPGWPDAWKRMGLSLSKNGQPDASLRCFLRSKKLFQSVYQSLEPSFVRTKNITEQEDLQKLIDEHDVTQEALEDLTKTVTEDIFNRQQQQQRPPEAEFVDLGSSKRKAEEAKKIADRQQHQRLQALKVDFGSLEEVQLSVQRFVKHWLKCDVMF